MRTRNFTQADLAKISRSTPSQDTDTMARVGASPLMGRLEEDDPDELEFRRKQMEEMNPAAFGRDFTASNEIRNNQRKIEPEAQVVTKAERAAKVETKPTPPYARKTETQNDSSLVRQELPSHCIPYKGRKDIFIKPIDFGQLGMLSSANKNQSLTLMIDALAKSIHGVDVRNLTPEDFTFVMYNVRNISYPTTTMKVNFTTRYGNQIVVPVILSELEIVELAMTEEEYQHYYDQGIQFPTVRDLEILFDKDLDESLRYTLEYAQYMRLDESFEDDDVDFSDYIDAKIAKLNEKGVAFTEVIDEFARKAKHGVDESVVIRDSKFDPLKAATFFEQQATNMVRGMNSLVANNRIDAGKEAAAVAIMLIAAEMMAEVEELREKVAAGETVIPKEETVAVMITATDFFPFI
jgi:hypothetical protein